MYKTWDSIWPVLPSYLLLNLHLYLTAKSAHLHWRRDLFSLSAKIFSIKLVFEVVGGAGAIWGFSEALLLRNPGTVFYWRPIALFIGIVFSCMWLCQIKDYSLDVKEGSPVESELISWKLWKVQMKKSVAIRYINFGGNEQRVDVIKQKCTWCLWIVE